jgi:hypothetical protein
LNIRTSVTAAAAVLLSAALTLAQTTAPAGGATAVSPAQAGNGSAAPQYNSPANIKARELIQRSIAALGGEKFLNWKYRSMSGRLYGFNSSGELDSPGILFWQQERYPDADRFAFTKDRDIIRYYIGDKGWELTYLGLAVLKADQVRDFDDARNHSLDRILRTWINDPQTLMIYKGISMVDMEQVEEIDLFNKNDEMVQLFFDINSHLPVSEKWKKTDSLTGGIIDETATYGNYQNVDGIMTPLEVQRFEGEDRVSQRFYQEVNYSPLPDSVFTPVTKLPPKNKR